ncbi:enoyl-CoA hydratase [Sphingobium sp. 22B]|uniref:enoyl-CoA hydratase/isomerase family protein n=1 Tax=unclassified Sphingobium TaxID=2611147 RepID=UPI0007808288|nr:MULTISPECIES: enoyl-CoA hydratase/isomerase family protein [unclassified Sphingobium]KXU32692.1 enoyl-CoA hydratase [Sphingobium sp. AM]KYC32769.1 enoyl-CoA hydratase [Sphingobium sp. 22B]OAP31660.1 enoyl-CoA hydratase [Sphingobium sp. 20006FA]
MSSECVAIEQIGRVALLTMQFKPHNLIGFELIAGLSQALDSIDRERTGALILRSSLRHFSAGADLGMFEERLASGNADAIPDLTGFMAKWEAFPLPIVAAVHGVCVGGGFELALMCDYIVAGASAKIGAVEASLGLHPLMGGVQRQVQRVGALRAKEISMLARRYDAATLERWNLINLVVADDRLDRTAFMVAEELAHGPTKAHAATKKLVQLTVDEGVAAADAAMADLQKDIWESEDLKTGIAAFRASGPGAAKFAGR